jgi:hypothetical protein
MPIIHDIEIGEVVPVPFIAGQFSGLDLLILGCGRCVWDDYLEVAQSHKGHIMVINRMIMDFPGYIDHGVSCHPYGLLLMTIDRRFNRSLEPHFYTHSCGVVDYAAYEEYLIPQFIWDFSEYYYGTSTLTAVLAALVMGYENITLAGVPLDNQGCYYNPLWKLDYSKDNGDKTMENWERAANKCFHGKVKSLSGKTRELLGAPYAITS